MTIATALQAVQSAMDTARQQGFGRIKIKYAGGEPTLRPEMILAIHDAANRLCQEVNLGMDGVILSNGVHLPQSFLEQLVARNGTSNYGPLRLSISLDGLREFHDRQRKFSNGEGSFTHVERTVAAIRALSLPLSVSLTLSQINLPGLPDCASYLCESSIPFSINFYRPNDYSSIFPEPSAFEDGFIEIIRNTYQVIADHLPAYKLLGGLLDRVRLDYRHEFPCGVAQSYLVFRHDGQLAKCHMQLDQPVASLDEPDLISSLKVSPRGIQNLPVGDKEGCRQCLWRFRCAGGCPILTHRISHRYDSPSPNCRIYKALIPEALRLEGLRLLKYNIAAVS